MDIEYTNDIIKFEKELNNQKLKIVDVFDRYLK